MKKNDKLFDMESKNTKEKIDVILKETTGISLGIAVLMVVVTVYILTIKSISDANSKEITALTDRHSSLRQSYIEHTRIVDEKLNDIAKSQGKIEGMLEILLKDKVTK